MAHQITVMQNVGSGLMRRYQLNRDGTLMVEMRLRTGKTAPNRIGMQGGLPLSFDNVTWTGVGPWDTYADRNGYGEFGIYHQKVSLQDEHLRAQEHGNKTGVYEMTLTNEHGNGLFVKADEPIECSVWPYTLNNMQNENRAPERTVFNINCTQNGLNEVTIQPHSTYMYNFTIKPIRRSEQ